MWSITSAQRIDENILPNETKQSKMKASPFLSFGIENILKDTPVFTRGNLLTSEVTNISDHLAEIVYADTRKTEVSSPPSCLPSPTSSSADDATELEELQCDRNQPKRKKLRTTFEPEQRAYLENYYSKQRYLGTAERKKMAVTLGLSDQQVKTWFQNRRMKDKRRPRETCKSNKNLHAASHTSPANIQACPTLVQNHNRSASLKPDARKRASPVYIPQMKPVMCVPPHVQFIPYHNALNATLYSNERPPRAAPYLTREHPSLSYTP